MRRCRSVRWLERVADGGVDVGRRARRRHEVGRLEPHEPEVGPLRIEDQHAQLILRLARLRLRDDQVLAPLRHFGPRGHEVERRRLPDVHAGAVGPLELEREVERPLLHATDGRAASTRFQ